MGRQATVQRILTAAGEHCRVVMPVNCQGRCRLPQVGWANASLRHLQQLPAMPEAPGTGVFREDPITAGMAAMVQAQLDVAALQRLKDGRFFLSLMPVLPPYIAQSLGSTTYQLCCAAALPSHHLVHLGWPI